MRLALAVVTVLSLTSLWLRPVDAQEQKKRAKERIDAAFFERLDANKDGNVLLDEIPPDRQKGVKKVFERLDKDADGKLTRVEFDAGMGKKQARAKKKTGKAKPATTPEPVSPQSSTRPSEPSPSAPPESTNSNNRPPGPQGGPPLGVGPGLFRVLDLDADGKLAKAELAKAADTLMKFDKDADGLLAPDELAEGFRGSLPPDFRPPGFPPGDPARFMEMMQRADKNGDGKLTKDEMPERLRDRFDEIDRNKDGMLDKEELGPMGERLRRMREQGGATPGLPGRPGFGPGSRPGAAINDRNRERVAGLLRDYDKDIDGRISAKEFGESRADEFKGLDANGDGYLSPDELARRGQNR